MRTAATALGIAVLALMLTACQDQPATGPTTADFAAEREKLAAQIKKRRGQQAPQPADAKLKRAEGDPTEGNFAAVAASYQYDPTGKRDPFRSYRWEREARLTEEATRGPLEQFDLGQLAVVAVVWDTNKARALIEDPSGRAYIVSEGAAVGKNQGRVIHIDDNLVLVKETYENYEGEETTKDVELRIRRSQGG